VGVDGTTGTTAIAGNVSVGSPGASGARLVSVATADGEAGLQLSATGQTSSSKLSLSDGVTTFHVSKVATLLQVVAEDGDNGDIAIRAANNVSVSSGAGVTIDNDVYIQRNQGDSNLMLVRSASDSTAALKFYGSNALDDGPVFELSSRGKSVRLGRNGLQDGVNVSKEAINLRAPEGQIKLHSPTVVLADNADALLSIAPTASQSYFPGAATLRLNQHLHGDGTKTKSNCSCKARYTSDVEQGNKSFAYRCAPGTPQNPNADTLWCAVDDGCGFPNTMNVTLESSTNFFTAPLAGTTKLGEFDGTVGFEFVAQSNFKIMSLGRSVPTNGRLSDTTQVQLWSTQTALVVASVTVGPVTPLANGYALVKLERPYAITTGARYRLSFTARFNSTDVWYNNSSPFSLFNSTVATLTHGVYGDGGGYPIDNVPGQIVYGVPTFATGDTWQENRTSFWYDYCHPWSGAEISMAPNSTSLSVNLFGTTDAISINPGAQGSFLVQDNLFVVDVARNRVGSSGDVVVDSSGQKSNVLVTASQHTVRLTSSDSVAGYSEVAFEDVGTGTFSIIHGGKELVLNDTGSDTTLKLSPSGGTVVSGSSRFDGEVQVTEHFVAVDNVSLGAGSNHHVTVYSPSTFLLPTHIKVPTAGTALTVSGAVSLNNGLTAFGDVFIDAQTVCNSSLRTNSDTVLGASSTDSLLVYAAAAMNSSFTVSGESSLGLLRVRDVATHAAEVTFEDSVKVIGPADFGAHVQLGDNPSDMIVVNGTFHMNSDLVAYSNVSLGDSESDLLVVRATTTMQSPFRVHSDVLLGNTVSDSVVVQGSLDVRNDFIRTLSVRGDLVIKNAVGAKQLVLNTSESKMSWTICTDACGIKNGDSKACADVCGVPNGDGSTCRDACGVANGNGSTCVDACGVPHGDGTKCTDVCGVAYGNFSTCDDQCGVPNGDTSSCVDQCGVPNGNNTCVDACGVPNGDDSQCSPTCSVDPGTGGSICVDSCGVSITVESCQAAARVACSTVTLSGNAVARQSQCEQAGDCSYTAPNAGAGVQEACTANAVAVCSGADISGDDATSRSACESTGTSGTCVYVQAVPGNGTSCRDVCGVPNGDGSTCRDACGVANGKNSTCIDVCGVPHGDGSKCTDVCGVAYGNFSTCDDQCGVPNGDNSSCVDQCGVPNGNNACFDGCGVPNGNGSHCAYTCNDNMYIDLGSGDLYGGGVGAFEGRLSTRQNLLVGMQASHLPHASLNISDTPHATLRLHSLTTGTSSLHLTSTRSHFVIEKNASILRIDASDDIDGALHLTPGSSGELRVAGDKVVVAASDGETNITGSVHIGDASRAGMPRLLRVFEPSGGTAQLTVSSTAELRLASASATDAAKISLSGGAYLFELAQVGSTLSIASTSNDGSVFVSPGATGRFAVRTGAGADLVGVDGTTGTTAIAGNVSVGSPGASGARLVSVATADGEAGLQLFSGGNAAKAGIYLTSPSASGLTAQFRVLKTDCPLSNGLPRPACSSLRLDASAAGTNGEVRVLGAKIHVDDGHLMANELTLRSATAVGFQGETIDLNSGQVTSGASVLAISPGPTMPNDPLPTETITINNRRITPTSLVLASVVAQCNSRSGVTIVKIAPQVGTVSFEVANFGTRACGGGDINQNERYTINFFLMGDTNAAF
jgi:hypothetical protein